MSIDLDLFFDILNIDSTTSKERRLADFLLERLPCGGCTATLMADSDDPDAPANLLLSWGEPRVTLCTHLDTVPPYIPPTLDTDAEGRTIVRGRGACDAKGQIIAMYTACCRLAEEGHTGFALLLLHGEETGSHGAKAHRRQKGGEYIIVGEPTDNRMASASKGTKAFAVTIAGTPCHSGYPQCGASAVERFIDLCEKLRATDFPVDPVLGETTYNIGCLHSDNAQNILSPRLDCRIYFRTTFASDEAVRRTMAALADENVTVSDLGGDSPTRYMTLPGYPTAPVAFGSDAPQLDNYRHRMLCGPGSILVAHTPAEYVRLADLEQAADQYADIFQTLMQDNNKPHID